MNKSSFIKKLIDRFKKKKSKDNSFELEDQENDNLDFSDTDDDFVEQELENRPPPIDDIIADSSQEISLDDSPPDIFKISEEQKKELDELDYQYEKESSDNANVTKDRPIDLDAIKNYQITDEDKTSDISLTEYQEFSPKKNEGRMKNLASWLQDKSVGLIQRAKKINVESNKKDKLNWTEKLFKKVPHWDTLIENIFSARSRKRVHNTFLFLFVITATYITGSLLAIILKGPPSIQPRQTSISPEIEQRNYRQEMASLRSNNLFNARVDSKETIAEIPEEPTERIDLDFICDSANRSSNLPITLINTVVLQDSVKSVASVQLRGSRDLKNFREGEKINNMAEINKIDRLKVILKNLETGECEYVATEDLPQKTARSQTQIVSPQEGQRLIQENRDERIKNEGDQYVIDRSFRQEMLGNINEILTQARAVQIRNPDGTYSFKMTEIVPGSIYSHLGIQNGDIISGIDGSPIRNIGELMNKFARINEIDNLEIQVQRNDSSRTFSYEFQ